MASASNTAAAIGAAGARHNQGLAASRPRSKPPKGMVQRLIAANCAEFAPEAAVREYFFVGRTSLVSRSI